MAHAAVLSNWFKCFKQKSGVQVSKTAFALHHVFDEVSSPTRSIWCCLVQEFYSPKKAMILPLSNIQPPKNTQPLNTSNKPTINL